MKLPESITKVTPFSKILSLFIIILLLFLSFYTGIKYQENINPKNSNVTEVKLNNSKIDSLSWEEKLKSTEEELTLAILNSGKIINKEDKLFKFSEYGVNSVLFDNKTVNITTYLYKRNKIFQKDIILEKNEDGNTLINIDTWEFNDANENSSDNSNTQVVFYAYENHGLGARSLIDVKSKWTEEYITKNGIKMFWVPQGLPRGGIYAIYLETYQKYNPTGHPVLLRIGGSVNWGDEAKSLLDVKEKIKKIADTISFR